VKFFSINKFVFDFCCLCLFCYNAGHHAISRQKHGIQRRVISSVCHSILVTVWWGRTDGRSRDFYVTTKISWLDRLPNWLSNGAPLTRWRAGSARVQRADRFFTNNPCYLSVLARTLFSLFKRFLYYRVFQNSCMGKAEQVGLSRDIAFEQPPLYGHCYL